MTDDTALSNLFFPTINNYCINHFQDLRKTGFMANLFR